MSQLQKAKRVTAEHLFAKVPIWEAIHSALSDGFGQLIVDNEKPPTVAALFYGGVVIYGGDPCSYYARDLVRFFPVQSSYWGIRPGGMH